jgi:hypothetical protein
MLQAGAGLFMACPKVELFPPCLLPAFAHPDAAGTIILVGGIATAMTHLPPHKVQRVVSHPVRATELMPVAAAASSVT